MYVSRPTRRDDDAVNKVEDATALDVGWGQLPIAAYHKREAHRLQPLRYVVPQFELLGGGLP